MMNSCKQMIESGIRLSKLRGISNADPKMNRVGASANFCRCLCSNSSVYQLDCVQISPNGKRVYLVDTLALNGELEAQGIPAKHAQAIISAMTRASNNNLEYVSQHFILKAEVQKILMAIEADRLKSKSENEANLLRFKSETQSSQDHHFLSLQREFEKLRNDFEKMRAEQKYEIDKVTAGQRLDLNLEKRHIRDELAKMSAEITNLDSKFDNKFEKIDNKINGVTHESKSYTDSAKYDLLKYCMGAFVSISAVGIGLLIRIFMTKQ